MSIKLQFKNSIKGFPLLILLIRYIRYILYRYFINFQFSNYKTVSNIKPEKINCKKRSSFFGYYNISPINQNGDVLVCGTKTNRTRGSIYDFLNVCIKSENTFQQIYQTKAWNWQQGCMLQWYPKNEDKIILNDYDDENNIYISKILNKKGRTLKTYDMPIYSVSSCGKFAITLNFNRLSLNRPDYGYFNIDNIIIPPDHKDGIWYLDLETSISKLIISFDELKNISYNETMKDAKHKVNHIDINPSGTRFMFLHRWLSTKGRFMRLITANIDGSDLYILNGDTMTSHCCWLDNDNIFSYCLVKNYGAGYFKFQDKTKNISFMSKHFPFCDGHPSISPDKRFIITDTYPDLSRMSYLYLYDILNDNIICLGRFYQPLKYINEKRIDLHPKWSNNSRGVFFESGHQGTRSLYYIDVSSITAK